MSMRLLAFVLHPSGLPHAETLGIPVWVQWLIVAAVLAIGIWLVLEGREPAAGTPLSTAGEDPDAPAEWEPGEALVAGRSAPGAASLPPRPAARAMDAEARSTMAAPDEVAATASWGDETAIAIAPGARVPLALGSGTVVYVETGTPDLACEQGALRVHRASSPRIGVPLVPAIVNVGRQVRLGVGDLVVAAADVRVVARDTSDRPATLLLFTSAPRTGPTWLNPIRMLALLLGVGAGVLALDRARAVEALASMLRNTGGGLAASRLAFSLAALFLIGGVLAPTAPRASALAFAAAAGLGVFLATAGRWEERLEWWGAEYVLTAWEHLPVWAGSGAGLALLALAGWWYRPRRPG